MSWLTRLAGSIILTSPDGNVFEALWRSNERSLEKKLSIKNYPKVKGTHIDDLDVGSWTYPLTIFLHGADHDIEAERFAKSLEERGRWDIVHPTKGALNLQLVSATETVDPVENGNRTIFNTEWIDPISPAVTISTPQLANQVLIQTDVVNELSSEQFNNNIVQNTASEINAIQETTNKLTAKIEKNLSPLYENVSELNAQITTIISGIQDAVSQTTIDVVGLAGQIQTFAQLPVLAVDDITARLNAYGGLILDTLGLAPSDTDTEAKNSMAIIELTLASTIVAMAQTGTTGTLATRSQAVESAESISDKFIEITDGLDNIQKGFVDKNIDEQYFSQTLTFSASYTIAAQSIKFLLLASYDLAIEKRFVLERPRSPIEIAITEYGGLGENDSNVDLFLKSNELKDNDIIVLPAGREVVVYV